MSSYIASNFMLFHLRAMIYFSFTNFIGDPFILKMYCSFLGKEKRYNLSSFKVPLFVFYSPMYSIAYDP